VVSVGVDVHKRAVGPESRVVDQNVDHPPVELRDQVSNALVAAQITDHQLHLASRGPLTDALPYLLQPSPLSPGENQL